MKEEIAKWYQELKFPQEMSEDFYKALNNWDGNYIEDNPLSNLLFLLSKMESLEKQYISRGIPREIFIDTQGDVRGRTIKYFNQKLEIGVEGFSWLSHHSNFVLFKIGRLQFKFGKALYSNKRLEISAGENVIEIHIPREESSFGSDLCSASLYEADKFFLKYFPEYKYRYYTCLSWLLDFNLKEYLKNESNIIKFQQEFDLINYEESSDALRFLEKKNDVKSNLHINLEKHLAAGRNLYMGFGVIKHENSK